MAERKPKAFEPPKVLVGALDLAGVLGVTERRVYQLADKSIVVRAGRGTYDLYQSMRGYIVFAHEAMGKRSSMDDEGRTANTKDQRARLLDVELATKELALAQARGQVMAIDDHHMIMSTLIVETKARVMTIGARAAPKLAHERSRTAMKKVIDTEAAGALAALAKVQLPDPALPKVPGDPTPAPKRSRSRKSKKR